jgi:hypothetical protein
MLLSTHFLKQRNANLFSAFDNQAQQFQERLLLSMTMNITSSGAPG